MLTTPANNPQNSANNPASAAPDPLLATHPPPSGGRVVSSSRGERVVSSKGREQSNTEIDSSAINRHQPSGGERLDIVFDADDVAWVATQPTESTMCRIEQGRVVHQPSVMTRRIVRRATQAEVDQWRDG